jgi:hypothetical protein
MMKEEQEERFTNGPIIYPLELTYDDADDNGGELDSLLKETCGDISSGIATVMLKSNGTPKESVSFARNFHFRRRLNETVKSASGDSESSLQNAATLIRGFVRSHIGNASTSRNFNLLVVLAFCTALSLYIFYSDYGDGLPEPLESKFLPPHTPSLGDSLNSGSNDWYLSVVHQKSASDDDEGLNAVDATMPGVVNVGTVVQSSSVENKENKAGHYLHDPFISPYASPYYAMWTNNTDEQAKEQTLFEKKMASYLEKYGQWTSPNFLAALTYPDFSFAPKNRDLNTSYFPSFSWQSDRAYLQEFLSEGKRLVARVKEGIFEEFGYGILDETSTTKKEDILAERIQKFKVLHQDRLLVRDGAAMVQVSSNDDDAAYEAIPAIAFLNEAGWEALIRKLLHSMMTLDDFYVVLVGNANTFLSNNFQQSSIMEFNYIMEPVFDRLGMKLISRNMGMNSSTTVSALGGADIYGEADIFWHVPDERPEAVPESGPMLDFLFRQAILSGDRVPIILTPFSTPILEETNYKAWLGNLQPGASFCDFTYTKDGKTMVPQVKACRYVKCRSNPSVCDKHNSVCWVPRSDWNPAQAQDKNVGHQRDGYPSLQKQRLEGRKLAMLVLKALDEALDRWIAEKASILPESMWHVGPVYEQVREQVRTMQSGPCGRLFRKLDSRICHIEMHAFTEWTPRVDPIYSRLKRLVSGDVADKSANIVLAYREVALLPPEWKITESDVDVHLIAIATNKSALPDGAAANKIQVKHYEDVAPLAEDDIPWDDEVDHDYGFDDEFHGRNLLASDLVSPRMWSVYDAPIGFCDGSAQSSCNRNALHPCLLANYNHYRAGIIAHGQSGVLRLSIPSVKQGIVLARFDWQLDGGPRVRNFPPDFSFIFTVNSKTTTWSRMDFASAGYDVTPDLRVHELMNDDSFASGESEGRTVDIAMEVRSTKSELTPLLLLSHIYFA